MHLIKVPHMEHAEASLEWSLMGVSVALATVSSLVAYHLYVQSPEKPSRIVEKIKPVYNLVYNKYFVDEAYFGAIINPLVNGSKNLWLYVDVNFIDKATYLIADIVRGGGTFVRGLQNGNIQQYALYIALGVVLTLSIVLAR